MKFSRYSVILTLLIAAACSGGGGSTGGSGTIALAPLVVDNNGNGLVEPFEWLKTCPGFSVGDWLAGGLAPLKAHVSES